VLLSGKFRCFLKIKEEDLYLLQQSIATNADISYPFILTIRLTLNSMKYSIIGRDCRIKGKEFVIINDTYNDAKRCKSNPPESVYIHINLFHKNEEIDTRGFVWTGSS